MAGGGGLLPHDRRHQLQSGLEVVPHILRQRHGRPSLHSCNGVMDVVVARKGGCCRDTGFALSYVVGQEYNNELMSYIKAKALEINSTTDEVVMLDGEVFPGPNPFRFVSIPSLLTVFGEYCGVCNKYNLSEVPLHRLPVHHRQPVLKVLGTSVPVVDVVGVLPHIAAEEGLHAVYASTRHISTTADRICSIAGADDIERAVCLLDEPGPSRAKEGSRLCVELLSEGIEGAPSLLDGTLQSAVLERATIRTKALFVRKSEQKHVPVEGVIPNLSSVVEHASLGCLDQILEGNASFGEELVEIVDVATDYATELMSYVW